MTLALTGVEDAMQVQLQHVFSWHRYMLGVVMQADKETFQELQSDSDAMQERLQQLGMMQPADSVC